MTSYLICIQNQKYVVDITDQQILIDGKSIQANGYFIKNSKLMLLRCGNRVRVFFVVGRENNTYKVMVGGKHFNVSVEEIDTPEDQMV